MFQKETIVDCKGHLLGRLASIIAKEILNGQKVRRELSGMANSLCENASAGSRSIGPIQIESFWHI